MASPRSWQLPSAALSDYVHRSTRFFNLLLIAGLALLPLALPGTAQAQAPTLLYVDRDAPGPVHHGATWQSAFQTLQGALDLANANGSVRYEIWVAEGTYYPDEGGARVDGDRYESFYIFYDNAQVYGGFAGTETHRDERDWVAHPTVLNGDIDGDGTQANNAYHVVYLAGARTGDITAAAILDGFTLTGGNADEDYPDNGGGGIYCDGYDGGQCSPTLANLIISGNRAQYGGGMYNDGAYGMSSPRLTNITISGNTASKDGGGMYNDGYQGVSDPLLTNVTISDNSALDGGGMYNNGYNGGESSPRLTDVIISGNVATHGGGMYNDGDSGVSSPVLANVTIHSNSAATAGGGMYNSGDSGVSSPQLADVIISNNHAAAGAGMYSAGSHDGESNPHLTGVTISGNRADVDGGGMYNDGESGVSSPLLTNVLLSGNSASQSGGAIFNRGIKGVSSPVLTNVTIRDNSAGSGGGMYNDGYLGTSSPLLNAVTISGNRAGEFGGGMYNNSYLGTSSPLLTNVLLSGNRAANAGGGMYNDGLIGASSPQLTHVTVSGNSAANAGGGMYNYGESGECSPALLNSIVWGNTSDAGGPQIANNSATPDVSYSLIQGGEYMGAGNIDLDPLFATPITGTLAPTTTGDYRLLPGSFAIDSGTNTPALTDIRGLRRPVGIGADMGAYEAQGFTLAITGGDQQKTVVGTAFGQALAVQVSSADGEPTGPGGVITWIPPSSGALPGLTVTTPFTVTSGADGLAAAAVTANGLMGSYGVTVTTRGMVTPAVFDLTALNQYTVSVSTDSAVGGSVSGGGTVLHGDTVTVAATANPGYTFTNWTEGGTEVSTDATYSFTATGNRTLVAHFTQLAQPLAHNDAAGVLQSGTVEIYVLANDDDPAGGGLVVLAAAQPAHGATSSDASRTVVRYTAAEGFSGEDSFTYTLQDANGLTSTGTVAVVVAPLAQAGEAPQVAVLDPSVQHTHHFTSSLAGVQADLPAGFFTGTVGATDIFFLAYTPVVTPTVHTLTPPGALRFGNFEFHLTAYVNERPQNNVRLAQPITLTIHYNPAILLELDPGTLQLYAWGGDAWSTEGITLVSHDISSGTLTVAIRHLSEFALFAAAAPSALDPEPEPDGSTSHLYLPALGK